MKKSLTKAEILRRKKDIAALFAGGRGDRRRTGGLARGRGASAAAGSALPVGRPQTAELRGQVQHDGLQLRFLLHVEPPGVPGVPGVPGAQVFFSPTKRLGGAVQRNRAKRFQRELYRHQRVFLRRLVLRSLAEAGQESAAAAKLERQLHCRWAFVIHHPPRLTQKICADKNCSVLSGLAEEQRRYQGLLHKLEFALQRQWCQVLQLRC